MSTFLCACLLTWFQYHGLKALGIIRSDRDDE